jgi:hypothetical protein
MSTAIAQIAPSLAFVMLYVADLDSATGYLESLGFRYAPEESTPIFREFVGGDGQPFAIRLSTPDSAKTGTVELYFKTPDLAALHAELSQKGISIGAITPLPFGTVFEVPSLDGHRLTMQQA